MTDNELKIYMKKRQQQFADPEILLAFEGLVNEILKCAIFDRQESMIERYRFLEMEYEPYMTQDKLSRYKKGVLQPGRRKHLLLRRKPKPAV